MVESRHVTATQIGLGHLKTQMKYKNDLNLVKSINKYFKSLSTLFKSLILYDIYKCVNKSDFNNYDETACTPTPLHPCRLRCFPRLKEESSVKKSISLYHRTNLRNKRKAEQEYTATSF